MNSPASSNSATYAMAAACDSVRLIWFCESTPRLCAVEGPLSSSIYGSQAGLAVSQFLSFSWRPSREKPVFLSQRVRHNRLLAPALQQGVFQTSRIHLHLARHDLFVRGALVVQFADTQDIPAAAHRGTEDPARNRPRFVQIAGQRVGVQRRTILLVGQGRKTLLGLLVFVRKPV